MRSERMRLSYVAAMLVGGLVLGATGLHAEDIEVGKHGPFLIHRIHVNGKFDRCAMTLQPGPAMFRISYNKALDYHMSTPPPPGAPGPVTMKIDFGPKGARTVKGNNDGKRAAAKLDAQTVEMLLDLKKQIAVDLGSGKFVWQTGAGTLGDVFIKLEDCTQKALGR